MTNFYLSRDVGRARRHHHRGRGADAFQIDLANESSGCGCVNSSSARVDGGEWVPGLMESFRRMGAEVVQVAKASPQQNCDMEWLNGSMRAELLHHEFFDTLLEARGSDRGLGCGVQHSAAASRTEDVDPGSVSGTLAA